MKLLMKLTILIMCITLISGCSQKQTQGAKITTANEQKSESSSEPKKSQQTITIATTTSTQDSGLLDYLLPEFKKETGIEVKVISVGSGKAFTLGKEGQVDALLIHAKADELKFIAEGHGLQRFEVMYNDFVIVGPTDDPTKIKESNYSDAKGALKQIMDNNGIFVSRGDDSGTHKKELALWNALKVEPKWDQYISSGKGMGEVLTMANEMKGYTLADRATYLARKDKLDLTILVEKDKDLLNQYSAIAINPSKSSKINAQGADKFIQWLISEKTQDFIGKFGVEKYGASLFTPNANK